MASRKFKKNGDKRDGKTFVALPNVVLDSPGYRLATHTARSLLVDIARQYTGHNNGKLVACGKYLEPLGWTSNSTRTRALRELQDCGLLMETRKGARPNKAAWFALTWLELDQHYDLDIDPKYYRRGGYATPDVEAAVPVLGNIRTMKATEARVAAARAISAARQNAALTPSRGTEGELIGPQHGPRASVLRPRHGAVGSMVDDLPAPSEGEYLEIPSPRVGASGVEDVRPRSTTSGRPRTGSADSLPRTRGDSSALVIIECETS